MRVFFDICYFLMLLDLRTVLLRSVGGQHLPEMDANMTKMTAIIMVDVVALMVDSY